MAAADLIIDIAGTGLTEAERVILNDPAIRGVILFTKNFNNKLQLIELINLIRSSTPNKLEISVDQEGGRVQRFIDGFTRLPPLASYGEQWNSDPAKALAGAHNQGWVVGNACAQTGIDVVYSPVLDLDHGVSEVIGNRAFHRDPEAVGQLGKAMMEGLHQGGVTAVAKHFPGHGGVAADSHTEGAIDPRSREQLQQEMAPYQPLIDAGLRAVMMAHVQYPQLDPVEAGYSAFWVSELTNRLGFKGAIYCDDLSMAAAHTAGSLTERVNRARQAGCSRLLICNYSATEKAELLDSLSAE